MSTSMDGRTDVTVTRSDVPNDIKQSLHPPKRDTSTAYHMADLGASVSLNQNIKRDKPVIRKVTMIDPKKIQRAGLDLKLAEAIYKNKRSVEDTQLPPLEKGMPERAGRLKTSQTQVQSNVSLDHRIINNLPNAEMQTKRAEASAGCAQDVKCVISKPMETHIPESKLTVDSTECPPNASEVLTSTCSADKSGEVLPDVHGVRQEEEPASKSKRDKTLVKSSLKSTVKIEQSSKEAQKFINITPNRDECEANKSTADDRSTNTRDDTLHMKQKKAGEMGGEANENRSPRKNQGMPLPKENTATSFNDDKSPNEMPSPMKLVVLENKILRPNEKIDLSSLSLTSHGGERTLLPHTKSMTTANDTPNSDSLTNRTTIAKRRTKQKHDPRVNEQKQRQPVHGGRPWAKTITRRYKKYEMMKRSKNKRKVKKKCTAVDVIKCLSSKAHLTTPKNLTAQEMALASQVTSSNPWASCEKSSTKRQAEEIIKRLFGISNSEMLTQSSAAKEPTDSLDPCSNSDESFHGFEYIDKYKHVGEREAPNIPLKKRWELKHTKVDCTPEPESASESTGIACKQSSIPSVDVTNDETMSDHIEMHVESDRSEKFAGSDDSNVSPAKQSEPMADANADVYQQTSVFNPRLLLIRRRDQLETDEVLTEQEADGAGDNGEKGEGESPAVGVNRASIKCGLCLGKTTPSKWVHHIGTHYGIGWKYGQPEIDITSRSVVLSTMNNYFKQNKNVRLTCRMCNQLFRSGLGLFGHIEACGLSKVRFPCKFCNKSYTKLSLQAHLRSCGKQQKLPSESKKSKMVKNMETSIYFDSGRVKRAAVVKAELTKDTFKEDTLNDLSEIRAFITNEACQSTGDRSSDTLNPEQSIAMRYYCKLCFSKQSFEGEHEVLQHFRENHREKVAIANDSDDSNYGGNSNKSSSSDSFDDITDDDLDAKEMSVRAGVKRFRLYPGRRNDRTAFIRDTWKIFIDQNHTVDSLYGYFVPRMQLTSEVHGNEFSMPFAYAEKYQYSGNGDSTDASRHQFVRLKRFESKSAHGEYLSFIGGSIKSLYWIPLPASVQEQYLAVVCRFPKRNYLTFLKPSPSIGIILIYKLVRTAATHDATGLYLHYVLRLKDGPVNDLAFLPSGGYDAAKNRLGIVAIATINPFIHLYALPLDVMRGDKQTPFTVIDLSPRISLEVTVHKADPNSKVLGRGACTKLCWSEIMPHDIIVAGYSSGYIGIWKINDSLAECQHQDGEIHRVTPIQYFFCGEQSIRFMALHYDTNGIRWLLVACLSRSTFLYDVRDLCRPTLLRDEIARSVVSSIDWSPIWEPFLASYEQCNLNISSDAIAHNPVNVIYTRHRLAGVGSPISQIHYNPLQNVQVCASACGDILFSDIQEMHLDNMTNCKYKMIALTSAISLAQHKFKSEVEADIESPSESSCEAFELCGEQISESGIGLLFYPLRNFEQGSFKNRVTPPQSQLYHLAITALKWNLNSSPKANHLMAVGYRNGFLRILCFNRKELFN